jgi:hypothetical protein
MRIADLELASPQAIPHRVRAEPKLPADFHERESRRVQTRHRIDGFGRRRLAAHRDSGLLEPCGDSRAITAEFRSYLVYRGSCFVTRGYFDRLNLCEPSLSLTDWAK